MYTAVQLKIKPPLLSLRRNHWSQSNGLSVHFWGVIQLLVSIRQTDERILSSILLVQLRVRITGVFRVT